MAWRVLDKLKQKQKIGQVLLDLKYLTPESLDQALKKSSAQSVRLGQVLVRDGYITEVQLALALGHQFKMEFLDLTSVTPTAEAIQCIPENIAKQQVVLPLSLDNEILTLAVFDPVNVLNIQTVSRITKYELNVKVSPESQVKSAIERAYSQSDNFSRIVKELTKDDRRVAPASSVRTLASVDSAAGKDSISIENLVNMILGRAVNDRASDIHIEPDEGFARVRVRVDGILQEINTIPNELYPSMVSRLKILGDLDISEKRNAQDGRFRMSLGSRVVDLRISTLPTVRGEKVVLRILDKSNLSMKLTELSLTPENLDKVETIAKAPYGIIFVTGPTGSGKSTTVYSMLNHVNSIEKNIITVEDPVEYQFGLINQVQVQPKLGFTFASVLKSILRQDPDIIMVGEIRDKETAEIAVRAALTGHLVITTLHTNNAVSTVSRLVDMGIDPTLISSSLLGVISQRLVRRLCKECRAPRKLNELELLQLRSTMLTPDSQVYESTGCTKCLGTGYRGRIPIFEVLIPNAAVRKSILASQAENTLHMHAQQAGLQTMRSDGILKMLAGITSPSEVLKVTLGSD